MAHFTTRQMKQLLEIDSAGSGIRAEVQELITRLTSGGVGPSGTGDTRRDEAKKLWDKGWGKELGFESFDAYLATIPEFSLELDKYDPRFELLILVDARLGIVKTCELLGIDYGGDDQTFEDFDSMTRTEKVYWARMQDGKKNRNKSVCTCRNEFAKDELGLTVHEALALFAQNAESFRNFALDITGSVIRDYRDHAAYLGWFLASPKLRWRLDGNGDPGHGSGSRRE